MLGVDGISDFDGLHSKQFDDEVQLYAFDILALDGDDLRKFPLHLRKAPYPASSPVALTPSTLRPSSKARSGQTCSRPPAT